MLKSMVREYFLDKNYNCAETMFIIVNKAYNLGLGEEDFKIVSAYGGGFGCGITCGALAGAMAVLGKMAVADKARTTEGFRDLCREYVEAFMGEVGHTDCAQIREINRNDRGPLCLVVVEAAAEVFERLVKEKGLASSDPSAG